MFTTIFLITLSLFPSFFICSPNAQNLLSQEPIDLINHSDRFLQTTSGDTTLPSSSFEISNLFTIYYEFAPANSITMVIKCKVPNQFFGIGFGTQMLGSDIWVFELKDSGIVATDRYGTGEAPPVLDSARGGSDDLVMLGYEINPAFSLVKVRRALDTGDPNDAVISEGPVNLIYATGPSKTLTYHGRSRGTIRERLVKGTSTSGDTTPPSSSTSEGTTLPPSSPSEGTALPPSSPSEDNTPPSSNTSGDTTLPSNSFEISNLFTIYYQFDPADSITMVIKCNVPNQFFGIGFGTQMQGSDMWVFELTDSGIVATDRYGTGHSPPVLDSAQGGSDDLVMLGYEINPAFSLVKVRRALNTGDPNDAVISEGPVNLIYATGPSRTLTYHGRSRGAVSVPLLKGRNQNVVAENLADVQTADSVEEVHAIINLIAWGILADIAIIFVRLMRGRKFAIMNVVISAQIIHSSLMVIVIIMSATVTGIILNRNRKERGSQLLQIPDEDFHFINGLVTLFLIIVTVCFGLVNMLVLKSLTKSSRIQMFIKDLHKVVGVLLYLVAKANVITGVLIYDNGSWRIGVYIYLFVLLLIHIAIRILVMYWERNSNKTPKYSHKPSKNSVHKALLQAINDYTPREELIAQFPGIKWVMLGNAVYDLTGWIHPGGNHAIEASIGREVGRYFYGNHVLEGSNLKPHKHSALAIHQMKSLYIGELTNYESVLIPKENRQEGLASNAESIWKIKMITPISDTVSEICLQNPAFQVKSFGTSLSWLSRHFRVSFDRDDSLARLYTTAFSLTQANFSLRQSIYKYFDEVMSDPLDNITSPIFTYDHNYSAPQDSLSLFIKNYDAFKGSFSASLHRTVLNTPANRLRIEGPIGRGLELVPSSTGVHCIICAGTGIFPFIDFLNLFLWKTIYELIKEKAGIKKAQQINVLDIPFEGFLNGMKLMFFGAFANEKEIYGIDIIKKLAEISKKYNRNNFTAMIKGYSDENITQVKSRFSTDFFKKALTREEEKYYVVGPPMFNEQVVKGLREIGVPKEKVMLV